MNTLERYLNGPMFDGTYKPTADEAQRVHRLLNRYVFNKTLRKTRFNIKNLKDIWAMCDGRMDKDKLFTEQIFLTNKFPHKAMFVTAIAHEMVHQWQWEVYSAERHKQGKSLIMSHGPSFHQWKKPLAQYMIPLSIKI